MAVEQDRVPSERQLSAARSAMVEHDLRRRGIQDTRVLDAMAKIPRHRFISSELWAEAYSDHPLPIADGQTISQPYIVALMTEALRLTGTERVLEIGTGSGYQAAILGEIGLDVWSIERSRDLHLSATTLLNELGYTEVKCILGDGTLGLPDKAPFDRMIASGSLPKVPKMLLRQLSPGGIFVGPIGSRRVQTLLRLVYHPTYVEESLGGCRFVPLLGAEGWPPPKS